MKATNDGSPVRSCFPVCVLCLLALACCPSGVWLDDFDNQYQIFTLPGPPRVTVGSVDTRGWGCGIWTIESGVPDDPANPIAFVAHNPSYNPYDNCCRSFRFEGRESGSGCLLITGRFEARDEKCDQSGLLALEIVR